MFDAVDGSEHDKTDSTRLAVVQHIKLSSLVCWSVLSLASDLTHYRYLRSSRPISWLVQNIHKLNKSTTDNSTRNLNNNAATLPKHGQTKTNKN